MKIKDDGSHGPPLAGLVVGLLKLPEEERFFGRAPIEFRLFGEWSWRMLFPTDITHLHFARSIDLAPLGSGGGASSSPPAWSSQP